METSGKFTVVNDEGKNEECEVLFTFDSDETGKSYVIYTNNSVDEEGNTRVFASVYDPTGEDSRLQPVETEKEWEVIEIILGEIQNTIKDEVDEDNISALSYEEFAGFLKGQKEKKDGRLSEFVLSEIVRRLQEEKKLEHIDFLFGVLDHNEYEDSTAYSELGNLAYGKENYVVAEEAFRRAVKYCKDEEKMIFYKNSLAALIRRGEVRRPENASVKEAIALLKMGVAQKNTCALINMTLICALKLGRSEDWETADQLISFVDKSDVYNAYLWWEKAGKKGDAEGQLVHLLLIRHRKILHSSLGNMQELFDKVKKTYDNIPAEFAHIVNSEG